MHPCFMRTCIMKVLLFSILCSYLITFTESLSYQNGGKIRSRSSSFHSLQGVHHHHHHQHKHYNNKHHHSSIETHRGLLTHYHRYSALRCNSEDEIITENDDDDDVSELELSVQNDVVMSETSVQYMKDISVLYEDELVFAVYKPPGLVFIIYYYL